MHGRESIPTGFAHIEPGRAEGEERRDERDWEPLECLDGAPHKLTIFAIAQEHRDECLLTRRDMMRQEERVKCVARHAR